MLYEYRKIPVLTASKKTTMRKIVGVATKMSGYFFRKNKLATKHRKQKIHAYIDARKDSSKKELLATPTRNPTNTK